MELCVITLKNDAKLEEELICTLKNDLRNLANFDTTLKICTLMGFSWLKYIIFELKKYRVVMHHYTVDWCKLWKKNDLRFHKWREKFGIFYRSTQNLNIITLRDFFVQGRSCWAKKLQRSYVMTLKGDAIFKDKLAGGLKNDIRNFFNFHRNSWKFENEHFQGLLSWIAYKVSVKIVQNSYLSWNWEVIQTLKKNKLSVWKIT